MEMRDQQRASREAVLAVSVLETGRAKILARHRYLGQALYALDCTESMEPAEGEGCICRVDGAKLTYHPSKVIEQFRRDSFAPVRTWIHVVMHCLFRHPFVHNAVHRRSWDLACDIAAESMVFALFPEEAEGRRTAAYLREMESRMDVLTAERVNHELKASPPALARMSEMEEIFRLDDHSCWYASPGGSAPKEGEPSAEGRSREIRYEDDGKPEEGSESLSGGEEKTPKERPGGTDGRRFEAPSEGGLPVRNRAFETPQSNEERWEKIERAIRVQLETISRREDDRAGEFLRALGSLREEKADYRKFLKRFQNLAAGIAVGFFLNGTDEIRASAAVIDTPAKFVIGVL